MKKIDKLVLRSFLGLFALTVCAAFFVLLMHFFLVNFNDLLGKGLGLTIYAQLASYVSIMATKQAFPLAILLASIMSLGSLGEHYELVAMKSAGISLPRVFLPLFFFVLLLSTLVFVSNSYIVPRAHLDAYSLLYDLMQKKPSIAIKEGIFYDGIPGYSIKVRKKLDDQKTLQGIMLYDHTQHKGNVSLTMAESGKIYTTHEDACLVIELYNGHNYVEVPAHVDLTTAHEAQLSKFYRSSFKSQKLLVSLASLQLSRTKQELFPSSHSTQNARQLADAIVAMKSTIQEARKSLREASPCLRIAPEAPASNLDVTTQRSLLEIANILHLKASVKQYHHAKTQPEEVRYGTELLAALSIPYQVTDLVHIYGTALDRAKVFKQALATQDTEIKRLEKAIKAYKLSRNNMLAWAVSCIIVFLIGAPLGVIIKKGGLGSSLFIATGLIIWHFLFEMLGEKWAQEGVISAFSGAWLANWLLLPFGVFFLRQAYHDAQLLGADFYVVWLQRLRNYARRVVHQWRSHRS
ncbi:MAG: LptF/LptG family permease [Bacteroidota bacterium]